MKDLNLQEHYEKMTEKEEPTLISTEKIKILCKCWTKKPTPPTFKTHTKEVFSDGWTKWICSECGQVKFTIGMTFKEEK